MKNKNQIAIIGGAGHIGAPLGINLSYAGYQSILIDINKNNINLINKGKMPFIEQGAEKILKKQLKKKKIFASSKLDLVKNCKYIISINSKAGYEAILYGKPVVTFGESFYKNSNLVNYCNNLSEFRSIHERLQMNISNSEILNFFAEIKKNCFKGALYDTSSLNLDEFSSSFKQILKND